MELKPFVPEHSHVGTDWHRGCLACLGEYDYETETIRKYWNDKQPSLWYSKKNYGTKEYYDEVENLRYNKFYPYIPNIAEFNEHKGEKVLEIGVGMGIDLKQYLQGGADCCGIDLTEGAIQQTRKTLRMYNLTANLQVMNTQLLKFKNNTFDLVYSFGVLHHTPKTQQAINEIYRVLKPEGKAIIMLYSKSWQHYVMRVFIAGILGGELRRFARKKSRGLLELPFYYGYWDYVMQDLINKYSEAYGFCPLTKLYHKKQVKFFFRNFKEVKIKHYHYKNNFFQRKYMQGNWIIKAIK